ncbi:hypothetical protein HPB49_012401 [Dermacentor silvarum]|uniref:Uncharacterized protein n=1 Tax=Dermacentor silvarum TaxID=543639 RepID=A0ACB8CF04_DERSI|nr:hypothetical protein HPB49_012401 [Dermacentor silvarum]
MSAFVVDLVLFLIKVLVTACDIITLPIYFVLHKPWVYWKQKRMRFAKPIKQGDPSSPYMRPEKLEIECLKGVQTLDEATRKAIRLYPERPALGTRPVLGQSEEKQPNGSVFKKLVLGDYRWLTYEKVDQQIDLVARGLQSIGLKPRQYLGILAETRAEWFITAQACFRTNVSLVTLYATLSNEGIVSAVNRTGLTHLVTSADLLPRVLSIADKTPSLTHIVYMEDAHSKREAPLAQGPQASALSAFFMTLLNRDIVTRTSIRSLVIPFSSLQTLGSHRYMEECPPGPDDIAIIMFTSGSTGIPKGVMATHSNLMTTMRSFGFFCQSFGVAGSEDAYIAFLPLAHMLELSFEILLMSVGGRIGYSSPLTLTDKSNGIAPSCRGDATVLKPTQITCVPLIADRIRKAINETAASKGTWCKALFDYAVKYKCFWLDLGFNTPLLNRLLFNKTSRLLGGKTKLIVSGSAPLSDQTRWFLRACLNCAVVEGYGLSETSCVTTVMDRRDTSTGRVGSPLPGCYLRLVDWLEGDYSNTDKPNPRGEVVVGGPCVTKGYFKDEELTRESFREEDGIRWFYTGDVGEIFPDGTLKIIDRKKDIVKLQHGEYVALARVEAVLKSCPLVENAFAYGNSLYTYLVTFVSPNYDQLQRLARRLGRGHLVTMKELCYDAQVASAAEESILNYARSCDLQKAEVPRKVKLCHEPWTPDTGLVTPTLKLCRKPLQKYYQSDINALYEPDEKNIV